MQVSGQADIVTFSFSTWSLAQTLGVIGLIIAIAWAAETKLPFAELICFVGYLLLDGVYMVFSGLWQPRYLEPTLLLQIPLVSAQCMIQLLLFGITAYFIKGKYIRLCYDVIIGIMILDSIWLLCGHDYGILNAHSFDTAIMACLMPYVFYLSWPQDGRTFAARFFAGFAFPICILVKGGTTGIVILSAVSGFGLYYFKHYKTLAIVAALGIGSVILKCPTFLDPNGRIEMWNTYFKWWSANIDPLFGSGLGSFEWMGPAFQISDQRYLFMHNDFLQVLYETGFVGLGLLCAVIYRAAKIAYKNPFQISSLVAIVIAMLTYFPLHYFISQCIVALLLTQIIAKAQINKKENDNGKEKSRLPEGYQEATSW